MSSTHTGPTPAPKRRRASAPASEPGAAATSADATAAAVEAASEAVDTADAAVGMPTEAGAETAAEGAVETTAATTTEVPIEAPADESLTPEGEPEAEHTEAAEPAVAAAVAASSGALDADERAELERLRAEVAATRAMPQQVVVAPPKSRPGRGRWTGALVLLLIAALLAPLSALANWSRSTLLDQDRYLAMVAPLAKDPAVQKEVSLRITNAVFEKLQVKQLTTQTLDAIAARPRVAGVADQLPVQLSTFAEPISNAIYSFTEDQVSKLVASNAFQDAWVAANREAHAGLVAALTGETSNAGIVVSQGQVAVNLGPFIEQIKPILIERGVPFADRIPVVNAQFVVLKSDALARAQSAVRLLDLLRVVLPVLALLALVAGVALAPARRRALVIGASMIVGTLVLLLLTVQVARVVYLGDLEQALLVPQVANVLFDDVTTPLRVWVRSSAMLFLLVAIIAWAAGPSSAARAVRSVPTRLSGMTGTPTGTLGSVSRFVARNTVVLRAVVAGLAVLALLVGDRPSAATVLLIAVVAALALTVVEVFRRWGRDAQVGAGDPASDDAVAPPGAPA